MNDPKRPKVSNKRKIKVLLVDDSPLALVVLKRMLAHSEEIEVVGTASNGEDALELIPSLDPQVVCTDLHMPKVDGLELTKRIVENYPRPILVISISVQKGINEDNIFKLLEAGAMDVFPKPKGGWNQDLEATAGGLAQKIKILSGVVAFSKKSHNYQQRKSEGLQTIIDFPSINEIRDYKILGFGASTGGPPALLEIFSKMPKDFPLPILAVQHISNGFVEGMVNWLNDNCPIRVKVAENGEIPQPGVVYFPEEDKHLRVASDGHLVYTHEKPLAGHRPAIDYLFNSIARFYGKKAICVLLTGMGSDGAQGMKMVQEAGGKTIAQDEETSLIFGMPQKAIELGAADQIIPLWDIPHKINRLLNLS